MRMSAVCDLLRRGRCYGRRLLFYACDLRGAAAAESAGENASEALPATAGPLPGRRFVLATAGDVAALPDYADKIHTRAQLLYRLERGTLLYLQYMNDELAWIGMASAGAYFNTALDQWVRLPAGWVDLHGIYTLPAWRNRGLARQGYHGMRADLRGRGYSHAVLQVDRDNRPSLRAIEHGGFEPLQQVDYLRLAWLRSYWFRRTGRRSAFCLRISKQPTPRFDRLYCADT